MSELHEKLQEQNVNHRLMVVVVVVVVLLLRRDLRLLSTDHG
jgi:hypothetical protein